MPGYKVHNKTTELVFCLIHEAGAAHTHWYRIEPFANDVWDLETWGNVHFKNEDGSKTKDAWIRPGNRCRVEFHGYDKDLIIINQDPIPGGVTLHNETPFNIQAMVTTIGGQGHPGWFDIKKGSRLLWARRAFEWETIAIKSEDDTQRAGVYANTGASRVIVTFRGFDKEIEVKEFAKYSLEDEHFDEAVAIADRVHFSQASRAPIEGGLLPSLEKCDIISRYTLGKSMDIGNANNIYELGSIINQLKYSLVGPAMVVSVTSEWVKVAAYSTDFDAIVVMGFPTVAVEEVAPKSPEVRDRLVAVSSYTAKTAELAGVIGDLTVGPEGRDYWYSFHPLIAEYLTDDSSAPIWKKHLDYVPFDDGEGVWDKMWTMWEAWKDTHGENYFRLGTPSKITDVSTIHEPNAEPPSYDAPPPTA